MISIYHFHGGVWLGNRERFLRVFFRKLSNPGGLSSIYHVHDGVRKAPIFLEPRGLHGGDDGIRTHDPLLAGQVLSQLSYTPKFEVLLFLPVKSSLLRSKNFTLTKSKFHCRRQFHFGFAKISLAMRISLWRSQNFTAKLLFRLVGPSGLEPPTSCLSGTRSNLLSYEPMWLVSDSLTWKA